MKWQAEQIVKSMSSPHHEISMKIFEFENGIISSKEELLEEIFEIIKQETTPREIDEKQMKLF